MNANHANAGDLRDRPTGEADEVADYGGAERTLTGTGRDTTIGAPS